MVNSQRGAYKQALISNKREWSNGFIKFLKLQKLEVRNTSEKSEKIRAKSKKLDEDAMLCNTRCGGQTDAGLYHKLISCLLRTSKVRIELSTKSLFFFFIQRENLLFGEFFF